MRKSSRGGVTAVVAKKKTTASSSFSQKRYHHRTPLGEINDEEDEQRVQEKDSPMTVRRKWNKEHGVFCGGNSPSSARFKATAMDKVLILNRRVDTLEVRTILRLKCLPLLLLELVTVFNLSFARDDVNVMSALN
jgi:ribulose-5-phosphate 4-epimerase/fuculose-1-phosphate aldolase